MKNKIYNLTFVLFVISLFQMQANGQTSELTVWEPGWGKVDVKGFSLKADAKVKLFGTGESSDRRGNGQVAYAWILSSDTRKVVWNLLEDHDIKKSRRLIEFEKELDLEKGDYEVYYAAGDNYYNDGYDFGDLLNDIFSLGRRHSDRRSNKKLYMTARGPSDTFTPNSGTEIIDQKAKNAIVSIIRTGDNEHIKKGFSLIGDTKIRVYAIGESPGNNAADYAWITNVKTNKRVWVMDTEWGEHAGGGEKNIYENKDIVLPAGSYIVHYVTDDSHSYEEWNVLPPRDPQFWGVTLWAISKEDYAKVKPFKEEDVVKPLVDLTKVRDNEYLSKGFRLDEPMDLRIVCLGESGGRDMADYGWIINADTRETVWEMKDRNSEHAGGASKNRMTDQVVHFERGNYIAYYSTDDSHSYRDWNSNPPFDPEQWGLAIWTENEIDAKKVKTFKEDDIKDKNVIAQIIKIRGDEHLKKSFSLDKDTKIRIYAIGEGSGHDMSDYGWIENKDDGRVVWEMTYRTTDRAGGSTKNRMFNGTIQLPKGNYILYYETDDSHSYRNWNEDPPKDPEMYGITLYYN